MRFCCECNDKRMCNRCTNQNNENKEFESNLNLLKDKPPTDLVICFLVLKNRMILVVINYLIFCHF